MRNILRGLRSFRQDPTSQSVTGAAISMIMIGSVFYRRIEDLSWIDSIYFAVITLTTVGYGDFSPETTAGKIFTMFYVIIGIGIVVALGTEIASHLIAAKRVEDAEDN